MNFCLPIVVRNHCITIQYYAQSHGPFSGKPRTHAPCLRTYSNGTGTGPQPSATTNSVKGRFAPYRQALNALAERTRTPLPSLLFSFAVLHELTAIVPLAGLFFTVRALNVGERVLKVFPNKVTDEAALDPPIEEEKDFWWRLGRQWEEEGRHMAERVGRRYGLFGFPKNGTGFESDVGSLQVETALKKAAPDIINFSLAYVCTKALLPVRIGLSLYWSPAFSRRVIEPTRAVIVRCFRQTPS
ncbi:hypothetical protein DAEQUDRAFT_686204 [Daedalea quercina L-15889]|uniref:Uncharacterized protein n=1 Tax=Daedalea quercina L-15889 TaxID=1314783 RepID=A0A165SSX7_9APHY|nr:hypothetical protein DAEQUDRAFT_686204 [Daedalea quercina L-15889]